MALRQGSGLRSRDALKRICEILLELLQENKNGTSERQSSSDSIAAAVETLARTLVGKMGDIHSKRDFRDSVDALLQVEEVVQEVLKLLNQLRQENQSTFLHLELCQEMEGLCRNSELIHLCPLSWSISIAIRGQHMETTNALRVVESILSDLHLDDKIPLRSIHATPSRLLNVANVLKKTCINPRRAPWSHTKELVKAFSSDIPQLLRPARMERGFKLELRKVATDARCRPHRSVPSQSVIDAVLAFSASDLNTSSQCFMIVGPEGSGKSHCCYEIEKQVPASTLVIRPSLPHDAMGLKVGGSEHQLAAMVTFAKTNGRKTILLFDDIDCICRNPLDGVCSLPKAADVSKVHPGTGEPHISTRIRGLLQTLIEAVHDAPGYPVLLICTTRGDLGQAYDIFDQTFVLNNPSAEQRKEVILSHVIHDEQFERGSAPATFTNLIENSSEISFAELALRCREALMMVEFIADAPTFLSGLRKQFQLSVPESLKSDVNADFVDMKIFTRNDLNAMHENGMHLPLFGKSVEKAWRELQRLIVMPICEARELNKMLFRSLTKGSKPIAGGVLLSGPPGCGKTALAYYSAHVASSINPSIKLLDVKCTSLIHKEVGGSESAIRRLFMCAKAVAPCILLMDGIENVAAVRGNDSTTEGTMDRVLSTLLTELDGVGNEDMLLGFPACLAIIGITHSPDWIDPALRRPGRLTRVIELDIPEFEAREQIAKKLLQDTSTSTKENGGVTQHMLSSIALQTEGFSGAGVVAAINEIKALLSKKFMTDPSVEEYCFHNKTR